MYVLKVGLGFDASERLTFFPEEDRAKLYEVDDALFFDSSKRMSLKNGEIVFEDIAENERGLDEEIKDTINSV